MDVPTIVAKVSALGYSAEPQAGDEAAGAAARSFGREAAYWRRRFWLSLLFTLPVFLLSMVLKHTAATKARGLAAAALAPPPAASPSLAASAAAAPTAALARSPPPPPHPPPRPLPRRRCPPRSCRG